MDNEAGFYKILGVATKINLTEDQFDDFNLQAFTCAAAIEAENRVNNCVTVYRYRGFMDFEGLRMYPTAGAYHGSDLNFWFGNAPFQAQAPSTAIEQATINYMMSALIAFVRDPEDGLANFGWPRYSTDGCKNALPLCHDSANLYFQLRRLFNLDSIMKRLQASSRR